MEIRGNKVIFKALVGSHSYGTNIEGSDEDFKGVFIQDPYDVLTNGYTEQIDVSKDEVYYELGRFLSLCATGNPTMLELLFTPPSCIVYKDALWDDLVIHNEAFLSKQCKHSFGGYAVSQIKKAGGLDKKMNWEKERIVKKSVEDFCWVYSLCSVGHYKSAAQTLGSFLKDEGYASKDCGLVKIEHMRDSYLLFCDDLSWLQTANQRFNSTVKTHNFRGISTEYAHDVCTSEVPGYVNPKGVLYFNRDAYHIHCKEYGQYQGWLKNRNTQRYVDVEGHGQQIDSKNLLHCVRLIETGIEIAEEGKVNVRRPNADYLVEIRKGKHDLQAILDKCETNLIRLDEAFSKSDLPDKIDETFVKELMIKIRQKYYESKEKTSNP